MAKPPQLLYWDSCVFTAYLGKEPARIVVLESLVDEIQQSDGKKIIVSSELSKVEVAFAAYEKVNKQLDVNYEQLLDDFWADDSVVELIEFHAEIAKKARNLVRESIAMGIKTLKPYDAVHLATAQWIQVSEFQTYNLDHFKPFAGLVNFKICNPHVLQQKLITG